MTGSERGEEISNTFYYTLKELEILNILESLKIAYPETVKTHDSIHEFMLLASLSYPKEASWKQKSAFLLYHWETFNSAHRALLEGLAGFYNSAYSLSRNTLELLVRGAFWECLAHKRFRDNAGIIEQDSDKHNRKSVKNWIEDLIARDPSIVKDLEETSASIFDKTSVLFEDADFQREYIRMPAFSVLIKQLIDWKIIDIPEAYQVVYAGLYNKLSKDVHVIPDRTDIGRRLLQENNLFKTNIIYAELDELLRILHNIIDIGIVVELNILADWIEKVQPKENLRERKKSLEDLNLKFSLQKLTRLLD